jgi:hypothetical protein
MNPLPTIALALSVALSASCGGRSVPSRFPTQSAASPEACEAPVDDPTVALTSDPPLPGEATGAWRGLDPDAGPAAQGEPVHAH